MNFCPASNFEYSITLAAPELPAGKCVAFCGIVAESFFVSVKTQCCDMWQVAKDCSAQLFCTVKGDLKFLQQCFCRKLKPLWCRVKSLGKMIAPARRIYSFRL